MGKRTHPIEDTEREETVSSQRVFGPDRQPDLDHGWDSDGEMLGANVAPLFPQPAATDMEQVAFRAAAMALAQSDAKWDARIDQLMNAQDAKWDAKLQDAIGGLRKEMKMNLEDFAQMTRSNQSTGAGSSAGQVHCQTC